MTEKRMICLAVTGLSTVFYIAFGGWLSFLILMVVLGLPWLSLLISLPAIWSFRCTPGGPGAVEQGQSPDLWLMGSCGLPMPPFRGRLYLHHNLTGKRREYRQDSLTDHCGCVTVTAEKVRVCDYLGLFAFPVKCRERGRLLVRPRSLAMELPPVLQRSCPVSWQPKAGGGFGEHHELRLYRPGDPLNRIHWKLTAKTGRPILRQTMEPRGKKLLLTLDLGGKPEETDRKCGRLLWLGNRLLTEGAAFEIRALTGSGVFTRRVEGPEDLARALDDLLCQPPRQEGTLENRDFAGYRHYHIGGNADEA